VDTKWRIDDIRAGSRYEYVIYIYIYIYVYIYIYIIWKYVYLGLGVFRQCVCCCPDDLRLCPRKSPSPGRTSGWSSGDGWSRFWPIAIWAWINTYENTIFNGMNIHKSQLFWCSLQGYKVLTHPHMVDLATKKTIEPKVLHKGGSPFSRWPFQPCQSFISLEKWHWTTCCEIHLAYFKLGRCFDLNPQSSFSPTQCAGADSPDPSDRIAGISIAEGVGENQFYPALESSWLTVFWHKKEK